MKNDRNPFYERAGHDVKYLMLPVLEDHSANHQGNHYALLLQPNLRRTSLLNLLGRPNPRINRQVLRRKRALHKGRVVFAGISPRNFIHRPIGFGFKKLSRMRLFIFSPSGATCL